MIAPTRHLVTISKRRPDRPRQRALARGGVAKSGYQSLPDDAKRNRSEGEHRWNTDAWGCQDLPYPRSVSERAPSAGVGRLAAWGSSDATEARRLVDICLDAGVSMFDSADVYSVGESERVLGEAIKGRRDKV